MFHTVYLSGVQGQLLRYVAAWNMLPADSLTRDPYVIDALEEGPEGDEQVLVSADETIEFSASLEAAQRYLGDVEVAEGQLMNILDLDPDYFRELATPEEFRAIVQGAQPAWLKGSEWASLIIDDLMGLTLNRNEALEYLGDWRSMKQGGKPARMIDESTIRLNSSFERIRATLLRRIALAQHSFGLFQGEPIRCLGAFFDEGMRTEFEVLSFDASSRLFQVLPS